MKFIDIAANLTDGMYQGSYHGKSYHEPDFDDMLGRAFDAGLDRIIVTAGEAEMSRDALDMAAKNDRLFSTVGVHPTRCEAFEKFPAGPDSYLDLLLKIATEGMAGGKVVAVGECGLDYDRLQFCDKATQQKYFAAQFKLSRETKLPMFLHMRTACDDFIKILKENVGDFYGGVVHSFTGTPEEALALLEMENVYIGINGCSLKTEENLAALSVIPVERMMIETDCPYCEIRNSHASKKYVKTTFQAKDKKKHSKECLVKGRNEPCTITQILEVIGGHKGIDDLEGLSHQLWKNTMDLFFPASIPLSPQ
ncbi:hypothetical protein BSKO_13684 [Bryopsis sp. KO-2023]|nr:hypothetical protein BSKO_13684 [Bryopsis sp. KO-2023]